MGFEIIYVDDGSTDNSLAVLKSIQLENDYITVIHQENQGSSGARNTAIEEASGQYIQFLDADDYIDSKKIIELLSSAAKMGLDLYAYGMDYVDGEGNKIGEWNPHKNLPLHQLLTGKNALILGYQPSSICIFIFRREFLNHNKLRITPKITHMDVEFMTRVMLKTKSVYFDDTIAYHYFQRTGSITKPINKKNKEKFIYDEIIIAELMRANLTNSMEKDISIAIKKNYNSVVWNLLWVFLSKPKEVDDNFKFYCLRELKNKSLYPISGPLKSRFQKISKPIFNCKIIYLVLLRISNKIHYFKIIKPS